MTLLIAAAVGGERRGSRPGERPDCAEMIELLVGDDDYGCEVYIRAQRAALGPAETSAFNAVALEGASLTPDAFAAAAQAVPFLAERRLVVVNRLLMRLSGGSGKRRSAKTDDPWGPWIARLQAVPDWTTVLLVEVSASESDRRRSPTQLPTELDAIVTRREFPTPREEALVAWARQRAGEAGARFAAGVAKILVDSVGEDTRRLAVEIDKLAAYADGQPIAVDDVQRLVTASRDASVFELADAVLEQDRYRALSLAHDLLDQGASPQYLVTMLERQLRLALMADDLNRRGAATAEARRQAGLGSDFVFRKSLAQSKRYTARQLVRRIELLCQLDSMVKTGTIDEAIGLDLVIASARRARPGD